MRRAWIVIVLLALLPVRGWAVAAMPAAAAGGAAHASASALPCHGEPSDAQGVGHDIVHAAGHAHAAPAGAGHDADSGIPAPATHLCATCDLCHSPLAVNAVDLAPRTLAPAEGLPVATAHDTGRLLAGSLERPPRP